MNPGSLLNNQDSMESERVFFVAQVGGLKHYARYARYARGMVEKWFLKTICFILTPMFLGGN